MVSVVWFRRDLRLDDNPALAAAQSSGRSIQPLFVWSPEEEGLFQPGKNNRWWVHHSLKSFVKDLESVGLNLVLRRTSSALSEILDVVRSTQAEAVYFNHLYDPVSLVRDNVLKRELLARGIQCHTFNADLLYEPWEVRDAEGEPYTIFSDFLNHLLQESTPPARPISKPTKFISLEKKVESLSVEALGLLEGQDVEDDERAVTWCPGAAGAEAVWKSFLNAKMQKFSIQNSKADVDGTSRISPHLHFGEISARRMWEKTKRLKEDSKLDTDDSPVSPDFLKQLGLREFSRYISFHFPFTHKRSMLEHLQHVPWNYDHELFRLWREGMTGYPIVDAGMRNLLKTGWTHNHIRVLCSTFLVKHLLLPWQWGMKYFWDAQIDADIEEDVLGWQYVSGCLQDAHPFDHMYDLLSEAQRFDASGDFTRKWVKELAELPTSYIHQPWCAPEHVLESAGVRLGQNYPERVITLEESARLLANASCAVDDNHIRKTSLGNPVRFSVVENCSTQASVEFVGKRSSFRSNAELEGGTSVEGEASMVLAAQSATMTKKNSSASAPHPKRPKS